MAHLEGYDVKISLGRSRENTPTDPINHMVGGVAGGLGFDGWLTRPLAAATANFRVSMSAVELGDWHPKGELFSEITRDTALRGTE